MVTHIVAVELILVLPLVPIHFEGRYLGPCRTLQRTRWTTRISPDRHGHSMRVPVRPDLWGTQRKQHGARSFRISETEVHTEAWTTNGTFLELVPVLALLLPRQHESNVPCPYLPRALVRVNRAEKVEDQLVVLSLERKV